MLFVVIYDDHNGRFGGEEELQSSGSDRHGNPAFSSNIEAKEVNPDPSAWGTLGKKTIKA